MEKTVRARIRKDRRILELPEAVPKEAGAELLVTLTGLPDPVSEQAGPPLEVTVWEDAELIGPFPLVREHIYEDG